MGGSDRRRRMGRNSGHRPVETKRIDSTASNISAPAIAPPPPHRTRRQEVILKDPKRKNARFAEIAGGKMAECAAIFCCCPFGLANLFFLAAVRLPVGLFCRAVQKRILGKKKTKHFESGSGSISSCGSESSKSGSVTDTQGSFMMFIGDSWPATSPTADVVEFEKEIWSKFCGTGFWRSLSQKDVNNGTVTEL